MTKTRTEKTTGFWIFTEAVSTSCPAIYILSSLPDLRRAYQAGKTYSARLTKLYQLVYETAMGNCEITNSQYNDYCEDIEYSNEGEIEAIARELAAVLGHTMFIP